MCEDWIQEAFLRVASATGGARAGVPPWERSWDDLHRALHICRIKSRSQGFRLLHRDTRIQLWLEGADDILLSDVRADMRAAFPDTRRRVLKAVRSKFDARSDRNLSEHRAVKISRQIGLVDRRISPAGFEWSAQELVAFVGAMRDGQLGTLRVGEQEISFEKAVEQALSRLGLSWLVELTGLDADALLRSIISGLAGDPEEIGELGEAAIAEADFQAFRHARSLWQVLPCVLRHVEEVASLILLEDTSGLVTLKEPCTTVAQVISDYPWSLIVFVGLIMAFRNEDDRGLAWGIRAENIKKAKTKFPIGKLKV